MERELLMAAHVPRRLREYWPTYLLTRYGTARRGRGRRRGVTPKTGPGS